MIISDNKNIAVTLFHRSCVLYFLDLFLCLTGTPPSVPSQEMVHFSFAKLLNSKLEGFLCVFLRILKQFKKYFKKIAPLSSRSCQTSQDTILTPESLYGTLSYCFGQSINRLSIWKLTSFNSGGKLCIISWLISTLSHFLYSLLLELLLIGH